VPEQALERRQRAAPHDEPTREVVPAAVPREGLLEPAFPNAVRTSPAGHTRPSRGPGRADKDLVDGLPHRDLAALAGLRLLQTQDAAAEVDPVPGQSQQLGPL
jgi:hypothetical protein